MMAARIAPDETTVMLPASRANAQRWIHRTLGRNDGVRDFAPYDHRPTATNLAVLELGEPWLLIEIQIVRGRG
jgi:hypothetical protein